MTALKVFAVITAPALIGLVNEPLAWFSLFVLPIIFAVTENKKKGE